MVFHTTFTLALFLDKKYWNCINLFPCILWDLIVMDLVLSGEYLIKTVEGHMRSTCWKFRDWSCDMANSQDDLRNALIDGILSVTLIPFTYTIYLHDPQNCKEVVQKKTKGFYNTHLVRESYSSSRAKFLYSLLLPFPIVIP